MCNPDIAPPAGKWTFFNFIPVMAGDFGQYITAAKCKSASLPIPDKVLIGLGISVVTRISRHPPSTGGGGKRNFIASSTAGICTPLYTAIRTACIRPVRRGHAPQQHQQECGHGQQKRRVGRSNQCGGQRLQRCCQVIVVPSGVHRMGSLLVSSSAEAPILVFGLGKIVERPVFQLVRSESLEGLIRASSP